MGEWNSPRDNDGADITHYQIFINSSEVLWSNVTMATIVLDLEEEHFIKVRAIITVLGKVTTHHYYYVS